MALLKAAELDRSPSTLDEAALALAEKSLRLDDALKLSQESAAQMAGDTSKISLNALTLADIQAMSKLAASWDTLGWVQFRLGNFDVAERYLNSAWSLAQSPATGDRLGQLYEKQGKRHQAGVAYARALSTTSKPLEETENRLQNLHAGKLYPSDENPDPEVVQGLRTSDVKWHSSEHLSAEFFMLFAADRTPAVGASGNAGEREGGGSFPARMVDVRFVSGSEKLRDAQKAVGDARFSMTFPGGDDAQIVRRGVLDCEPELPQCSLILIPPGSVHGVK